MVDCTPQAVNYCIKGFDIVKYNLWYDEVAYYPDSPEDIYWGPIVEKDEGIPILDESTLQEDLIVYIDSADADGVLVRMQEESFGEDNFLIMTREFFEDHFESLTEE